MGVIYTIAPSAPVRYDRMKVAVNYELPPDGQAVAQAAEAIKLLREAAFYTGPEIPLLVMPEGEADTAALNGLIRVARQRGIDAGLVVPDANLPFRAYQPST